MFGVIIGLHILICIGLIVVVLLQTGKGTGMASVFGGGGGGGESVFGGKGFGGVLAKATGFLAVLFMLTSITLTLIPRGGGQRSVLGEREAVRPPVESPVGETAPQEGGAQTEAPLELPAGE
jgi:preprotein translocase subunit SecG